MNKTLLTNPLTGVSLVNDAPGKCRINTIRFDSFGIVVGSFSELAVSLCSRSCRAYFNPFFIAHGKGIEYKERTMNTSGRVDSVDVIDVHGHEQGIKAPTVQELSTEIVRIQRNYAGYRKRQEKIRRENLDLLIERIRLMKQVEELTEKLTTIKTVIREIL